jgi:iron complex outermembrane receptor protein
MFRRRHVAVSTFACLGLLPLSVMAEDVPAVASSPAVPASTTSDGSGSAMSAELAEVTVTATRTRQPIQRVPIAITALTGRSLSSRSIEDMTALTNVVPGLTVTPANSPTSLIFNVRGVGNTNPNTGSDAAVGFYLDNVPLNLQNGTNLALFDIDRVQVLEGPQGTLFGRNATGGAILVDTKHPTDKFGGYIQAGGTFFQIGKGAQGQGALNVPMGRHFAVRLAFNLQHRDGWVRNIINPNAGPAVFNAAPMPYGPTRFDNQSYIDAKDLRLSALWHWAGFQNLLVWSGDKLGSTALAPNTLDLNPNGPVVQSAPFLGLPDPTAAWNALQTAKSHYYWTTETPSNNPLMLTTNTVSDNASWHIGQITLTNIIGWHWVNEKYGQDIVGLPGEYFIYDTQNSGHDFSDEVQLLGKSFGDGLQWVAGVFYFEESRGNVTPLIVQFDGPGDLTDFQSKTKSYALYAQGTQKLPIRGLSLTLGGRFTADHRDASLSRTLAGACLFTNQPATLGADACKVYGHHHFSSPTYNLSLNYQWNPDTLVYFATRSGYRSGGYSDTAGSAATFTAFQPETVTDYEVGLKKDWRVSDVLVRSNISGYHENYRNIQRLVVDPSNLAIQNIVNAGSAKVNGGELQLTVVPFRGLELGYYFAYVNPMYLSFIDNGQNFKGETFAFAPHEVHDVHISYTMPAPMGNGDWSLSADYHHQSTMFRDDEKQTLQFGPLESLQVPAYGIVNMNASWNGLIGGALDASFFVTNLTDTKVAPNGAPTYDSFGIGLSFFSVPPRMWGFNLRYYFGS